MGRKRRNSSDEESKKENQMDKGMAIKNAATANSRERARMQVLSKAFVKLKTTLPWVPPDTKLSKLDTLRLATSYIAHLRQILAEDDADAAAEEGALEGPVVTRVAAGESSGDDSGTDMSSSHPTATTRTSPQPGSAAGVHPINFTWPYSFHGKVTASTGPSSNLPDPPCLRSPDRADAHPGARLPSVNTLTCQTFT